MKRARAAVLWALIGLLTLGFGIPAIFAAYLPPRGNWFLRFARGWARSILRVSGITIEVLHPERLPRRGSFIVAANHESFADVVALLACLPLQVRFLTKRSIFRVPVLGWSIAAAGFVPVDRGDRSGSAATLEAALRRLESGRSLVIFPEETRSRGAELLPFKKGAALLAAKTGRPLLPLGLAGSRRILPRGRLLMSPGRIVVCPGDPIEAGGPAPTDRKDLTERLRERVAALRDEAAARLEG
jgi:1-acyl-sn-glycerol-3-phosphate acyltransferase